MRKKIQPSFRQPESRASSPLGELPVAEGSDRHLPHAADSALADGGCETAASDSGAVLTADEVRSDSGRTCGLAARVLIGLIKVYQWTISPLLPDCCRFEPSCSRYAVEALRVHGFLRGSWLVVWRLLRCQPFCKGGWDPVPPRRESSSGGCGE